MTNRELLNIIEQIKRGENTDLTEIARSIGRNRSSLSKFINDEEERPVTKSLLRDFMNVYPTYFNGGNKSNTTEMPPGNTLLTGPTSVTLQDYINKQEERINELRRDKEVLYGIVNSTLMKIAESQVIALAYQKAWVEYEAEKQALGDQRKKEDIMYKMSTLVDDKIKNDATDGSRH